MVVKALAHSEPWPPQTVLREEVLEEFVKALESAERMMGEECAPVLEAQAIEQSVSLGRCPPNIKRPTETIGLAANRCGPNTAAGGHSSSPAVGCVTASPEPPASRAALARGCSPPPATALACSAEAIKAEHLQLPEDPKLYELLGLDRNASEYAIELAYGDRVIKLQDQTRVRLTNAFGPSYTANPVALEYERLQLTRLRIAFEVLVDPQQRLAYEETFLFGRKQEERASAH